MLTCLQQILRKIKMVNNMLSLDDRVRFTWGWSELFLLQSDEGASWVWSDPDYGGDNTIQPFDGDYDDFCAQLNIPYGRCKGQNTIRGYCGEDVKILLPPAGGEIADV